MTNSLLTSNATKQERALELACARIAQVDVPIKHLWDPKKCPVELLPWLAWALSVDEWDSSWPEAIQRQVIADAIPVHQIKGTVGAIRQALSGLDAEIELTEWWQNGGAPYTAQLTAFARNNLDPEGDTLLTPQLMAQMWRLVAATKPARTHIYFSVGVQQDAELAVAGGCRSTTMANSQCATFVDNGLNTASVSSAVAAHAAMASSASMSATPDTTLSGQIYSGLAGNGMTINHVKMVTI